MCSIMPAKKYKHKQLKTFITLWKYFRMLRDPLAVKKLANPFSGQKYLQNPKNIWNHLTYQPPLASHVCECVCV